MQTSSRRPSENEPLIAFFFLAVTLGVCRFVWGSRLSGSLGHPGILRIHASMQRGGARRYELAGCLRSLLRDSWLGRWPWMGPPLAPAAGPWGQLHQTEALVRCPPAHFVLT